MSSIQPLPYDPTKIGQRLTFSGEHIVYRYGKNQVIKFPAGPIHKVSSQDSLKKVIDDFRFIQKYLQEFIPATELLLYHEEGRKKYCVIQDFLEGHTLKVADTKDPAIKKQLDRIVQANNFMLRSTKYTLEFFGIKGLLFHDFRKTMDNIIVTPQKELVIVDFGLISEVTMVSRSPILRWFIQWAIKRQKVLLAEYLH